MWALSDNLSTVFIKVTRFVFGCEKSKLPKCLFSLSEKLHY
jgi:hypothetical protein